MAPNHANTAKISRLLSIQPSMRSPSLPSRASARVSLRSSYTWHYHKNATRSAYQSQLLIKELLYSCWRHPRQDAWFSISPVLKKQAIWKANEGAITGWTWCVFEGHLMLFLPAMSVSVDSRACIKKRQRTFAVIERALVFQR